MKTTAAAKQTWEEIVRETWEEIIAETTWKDKTDESELTEQELKEYRAAHVKLDEALAAKMPSRKVSCELDTYGVNTR